MIPSKTKKYSPKAKIAYAFSFGQKLKVFASGKGLNIDLIKKFPPKIRTTMDAGFSSTRLRRF